MKKLILGISIVMLVILLSTSAACSSSTAGVPSQKAYPAATTAPTAAVPAAPRGPFGLSGAGSAPAMTVPPVTAAPPATSNSSYSSDAESGLTQSSLPSDRMVVRTGNIELVVSDVAVTLDNITKVASDFGGYVVTSQKWKEGERNLGTISIRVLAENYDKTVVALRALAKSVTSESTSSQDVTEEYSDLDSRVKNLEATETQLQKIMQTATKTEDILSIQRELTNVRGQIEQAQGRMQYLQRTSSTSLIQIKLNEAMLDLKFSAGKVRVDADESILFTSQVEGGFTPYNYQWDFGDGNTSVEKSPSHAYDRPGIYSVSLKVTDDKGYTNTISRDGYVNVIGGWSPGNVAKSAWDGFTGFGRVFVNILIWLGIFSPVWIVIGGIVWWSAYRKRRKARISVKPVERIQN